MNQPTAAIKPTERPYRSHKVPACDVCRRRKIRCDIDMPRQPCRFCRERNLTCNYSPPHSQDYSNDLSSKRRRMEPADNSSWEIENNSRLFPGVVGTSPDQSSLLLNPPMAEDIEILEHYLSSTRSSRQFTAKPYKVVSNTAGKPIVYLTVPRRRKGLRSTTDPGRSQREIVEQILGPHKNDVVQLYGVIHSGHHSDN